MINFEIKDLIKKPNIYFLSAVAVGLIWLLVSILILLPKATNAKLKATKLYSDVNEKCAQIFELDPERINYAAAREQGRKFDYPTIVNEVAEKWGIGPKDYDLRSQKPRRYRGGVSQEANITIKAVSITNLSQFLSELLDEWPDLSCQNLKITAVKDEPDLWKVTIKFKYDSAS